MRPRRGGPHAGAGRHLVTTTAGAATGFELDQLALDSAPGGGAMALGTSGTSGTSETALEAPAGARPAPKVQVVSDGTTQIHLRVSGATPGRPFWLVLGQSINNGWKATVDGTGASLGPPTLVDGFANGWLVDPGKSAMTVSLRWTPQGDQDLALLVSALAAVVCLALVLWPRRRRAGPGTTPDEPDGDTLAVPALGDPFAPATPTPPWVALPVGVICALVGAVLVRRCLPFVFLGVGAAVTFALLSPPARGVLPVASLGLAVGSVGYILVQQAGQHFAGNGSWPAAFETVNAVVWAAVLLLAADAVVGVLRRRP